MLVRYKGFNDAVYTLSYTICYMKLVENIHTMLELISSSCWWLAAIYRGKVIGIGPLANKTSHNELQEEINNLQY